MALLKVSGISKKEKGRFTVQPISFIQAPFEKIAIAGETGSGKTTLLKMIAGLAQPDTGSILFEQKKVNGPNDQLIPGHAGIAYLSQHFELRNNYWVHEILSYANALTQPAADHLYRLCRIDHLLQRRTDQLSGGEKQRIALARLLIGSPRLLLLDEPFSNLDHTHKRIIRQVINDITGSLGTTLILVSHDAADMLSWAERILLLKDGALLQQGTPEQVYRQPLTEYCAALLGECNLLTIAEALLLQAMPDQVPDSAAAILLVRPEQLQVNTQGEGLEAIVQRIAFMGSCYQMEATTGSRLLKIQSRARLAALGQKIWVTANSPAHLLE